MEIVKNAIKVGNSAGVLLPRKWLNSQVRIVLEPLNIEKDILEILSEEKILKDIIGVYIVGSYARGEQTIESDVDILAITNKLEIKVKKGKYDIMCVPEKKVEEQLKKNPLPIWPMLKEAKAIINENLIKKYLDILLSEKNLRFHIETTKSAMNFVKEEIKIAKETENNVSDASAYSLILRLRTLYIIDCLKKNKMWTKKEFLRLVKKISGSLDAYNRYIISKNKNTMDYKLKVEEAEKLMRYINEKITEV